MAYSRRKNRSERAMKRLKICKSALAEETHNSNCQLKSQCHARFKLRCRQIICVIASITALCGCTQSDRIDPGDKLDGNGLVLNGNGLVLASDGQMLRRSYPPGATDIVYIGRGWVSFKFNESCFLMADHGRRSAMTEVDCDE